MATEFHLHIDGSATFVDVDIETGTSVEDDDNEDDLGSSAGTELSRRQIYHQVSNLIESQTELRQKSTGPQSTDPDFKRSRGFLQCCNRIRTAEEHGGDCSTRFDAAVRAALGTFGVYSILIFPDQDVLGAAWIATLFMHANLKGSFGASLLSFRDLSAGILLTTAASYPFAILLQVAGTHVAQFLFPLFSVTLTFLIMSNPHLSTNNLLVAVMHIVLNGAVREKMEHWEPVGYAATFLIGITVALLVNIIPTPNLAVRAVHQKLERFEHDVTMLLMSTKNYADHASEEEPVEARGAAASIEMIYHRLSKIVRELQTIRTGAQVELRSICRAKEPRDKLLEWIEQTEQLLGPLRSIRSALTQRVLGEDHHVYNATAREAKAIIGSEARGSRDRLFDAMIATIAMLNAELDPVSTRHIVLPSVQKELNEATTAFRASFHRAMEKASNALLEKCKTKNTSMPVFAHLTRRMVSFTALLELAESLLRFLDHLSIKEHDEAKKECSWRESCCSILQKKWHFHDPAKFRLALKTAVGMFFGSLFVSVPYLNDIATPFAAWPGLTIASVSLANTGSSFRKASERLYGTLFAAGYALLVSNFFPGSEFYGVKLPAVTVFTFAAIYLQDQEHAYTYLYAAFSCGAMLFGGDSNDFQVSGLIPKRIELIFAGVVIFSFVELLLFPRSSRALVEQQAIQVFEAIQNFANQAVTSVDLIKFHVESKRLKRADHSFEEDQDRFGLEALAESHRALKTLHETLTKELGGAVGEPNFGCGLQLDVSKFQSLSLHAHKAEMQALLILKSLEGLAACCSSESDCIRMDRWPEKYAKFLRDVSYMATFTCEKLLAIYPDGQLRPQNGNNAVQAVIAASSFRQFHDVRLRILSEWSNTVYAEAIGGSESVDMVSVITISIATMHVLDFCREVQLVGKSAEEIAHNFPPAH